MKIAAAVLVSLLVFINCGQTISQEAPAPQQKDPSVCMIQPVVKILENKIPVGSGFIIKHNGNHLIVTARHVVFDEEEYQSLLKEEPGLTREIFFLRKKYSVEVILGYIRQEFKVSPVVMGFEHDFAVLRLNTSDSVFPGDKSQQLSIIPNEATLASYQTIDRLRSFDAVFVVGFPLGLSTPKISTGIIYVGENGHIESTAAITHGNSGSPLYDAKTYEVIGIAKYIYISSNGQQLNHISGFTSIVHVKRALEKVQ